MDCLSPIGPVYQAGTLSGNPVAMAAGLAQLRELLDGNAYDRLEQLGARLEEGIREAIRKHGRNYTFHRAGSMFCLFFTEQEVYDLDSAQKASKELFKPFFWNMLEQGVYFAPPRMKRASSLRPIRKKTLTVRWKQSMSASPNWDNAPYLK